MLIVPYSQENGGRTTTPSPTCRSVWRSSRSRISPMRANFPDGA
jgi:hypothetical protein